MLGLLAPAASGQLPVWFLFLSSNFDFRLEFFEKKITLSDQEKVKIETIWKNFFIFSDVNPSFLNKTGVKTGNPWIYSSVMITDKAHNLKQSNNIDACEYF